MYKLKKSRILNALILITLFSVFVACIDKNSNKIIRTLSTDSTQKLELQNTYRPDNLLSTMAVFDDELYYVSGRILFRTKVDTREIIWQSSGDLSEFRGTRSMIATDSFIYILTSIRLVAVDKLAGNIVWVTEIGSGHVGLNQQIVGDDILVYYGDKLFYIDKVTGSINNEVKDPEILWRNAEIEIRKSDMSGMEGYDITSNSLIWKNNDKPFRSDYYFFPVEISISKIVIRTPKLGICLMDILNGTYLWCHSEKYVSNIGFNNSKNVIYALRDDYTLVAIDLVMGEVIDEMFFLPSELPQELERYLFDYFVEVSSSQVVVYFGDSNQFFTFKQSP